MLTLFKKIFIWWNQDTFGTRLQTIFFGKLVGKDNYGNKVGSLADISTFSFYPGKNLGAYGDAGVITTNNQKFYTIIKKLRMHGVCQVVK